MDSANELIPHLFRTEYSKIIAVLCKRFGLGHIEEAEDIAGETFTAALETWPYKGVPENPVAWLYTVAKNKTRNHLNRYRIFTEKVAGEIQYSQNEEEKFDIDLSAKNIAASQLQMLFAVCHPSIPEESQIGLALRILCGFGIEEIANAFLTNKETINKRLYRAREKLRSKQVRMEVPSKAEIDQRLETVLATLYLLFNEGYYSESDDRVLKKELCLEAIRLTYLLTEDELTAKPSVYALLALFCFHSSRFEARKDDNGELILYRDQDETLWNEELITKGAFFLKQASRGNTVSTYHLEAGIAWWHTIKNDSEEKWTNILQLYNQLLMLQYSPIAALNRTYALSKVYGKELAVAEAEKLKMTGNQYYFSLLGELYSEIDNTTAKKHFETARKLAKNDADKKLMLKKFKSLTV